MVVVVEARTTLTPHFSLQTAAPVPARRRLRGAAALAAPLKVQLITGAPQDATPVPWCTLRRAKGDGVKRATAALARPTAFGLGMGAAAAADSTASASLASTLRRHAFLPLREPLDREEGMMSVVGRGAARRLGDWRETRR